MKSPEFDLCIQRFTTLKHMPVEGHGGKWCVKKWRLSLISKLEVRIVIFSCKPKVGFLKEKKVQQN